MSQPTPSVLWLQTDDVALGPQRADLAEEYWRWENDPSTIRGYGRQVPESFPSRVEGLEHQLRGGTHQARFTVYDTRGAEPVPVGLASLVIDHMVRTAEYFLVIAPEAQGQGIGTIATRLTLDYAFHLTGLRMVWLKVLEPNIAGIRAYEKAGFRIVGTMRDAGYWMGRPCGEVVMDAVPADFPGPSAIKDNGASSDT